MGESYLSQGPGEDTGHSGKEEYIMAKIPCEIIRDLLPLYKDDICSEKSRNASTFAPNEIPMKRLVNTLISAVVEPTAASA